MCQKKKLRSTFFRSYHSWTAFLYHIIIIIIINFIGLGIFMGAKPSLAADISGIVSGSGNGPVEGISVNVADLYSEFHTSETTSATGEYHFNGLASGEYIVWVKTGQSGYVPEFYNDAPNYSLAENINLEEADTLSGINFILSPGRSISGKVTNQENGEPIGGLKIGAFGVDSMSGGYSGYSLGANIPDYFDEIFYLGKNMNYAFTDINGIYTISGLSPDKYQVGLLSESNIYSPYIMEWYEDADNLSVATLIPLEPEADVTGIDLALSQGGSIAGKLTDPNGSLIKDIWVMAIPDGYYPSVYAPPTYAPPSCSDPNGRYIIGGLKQGDYMVDAGSGYYYTPYYTSGSNYYYTEPTRVSVQAGQVIGQIDFILQRKEGGMISGRVIDSTDGAPISGFSLMASPSTPTTSYTPYPYALTDPNGCYTFNMLKEGSYLIISTDTQRYSFIRGDLGKYLLQYYDGVPEYEMATPILLADQEEVFNIDFALATGGSISGRITWAADQSPITGAYVTAMPCPTYSGYGPYSGYYSGYSGYGGYGGYYGGYGSTGVTGVSDHEGKYTIRGLETDSYQIFIQNFVSGQYGSGYYGYGASSGHVSYLSAGYHEGECVSITAPYDNPNINFSLEMGGSISGTVIDIDTNSPLSVIQIQAKIIKPEEVSDMSQYAQYGGLYGTGSSNVWESDTPLYADTDMLGHYTLVGLPTGEYQIVACDKKGRYSCSTYQVVQIEAGQDITGINFSLKMGGTISGRITDEATGLPLSGIQVKAFDMDYDIFFSYPSYYSFQDTINSAISDQEGNYTITGLSPGKYRLTASGPTTYGYGLPALARDPNDSYLTEYYDNIPLQNQNDVFYTELSRELGLTLGVDITSEFEVPEFKVKGDSRFQLVLEMSDAGGNPLCVRFQSEGDSKNQAEGPYLHPDGSIVVPFGDIKNWDIYDEEELLDNQYDLNELLEEFKPGFVLGFLSSIDKIILRGNSYWIDYIKLIDANNTPIFIDSFDYDDLPTDHEWDNVYPDTTYMTMAKNPDSDDGALRVSGGQAVVLTDLANTITGCDFALSRAGAISGKVRDTAAGNPLEGIEVIAYDYLRGDRVSSSFTDQEGKYMISGLNPGEYSLLAQDPELDYLDQYYDHIENPYTGYVLDNIMWDHPGLDYHHFRSILKKEPNGSTDYNNHILEFSLKINGNFCLGLTLVTTEGKTVRIDVIPHEKNLASTILNDIIQVTQQPVEGEYNPGVWQSYRVDLNNIPSGSMNITVDYVKEIVLKGNDYCLDNIRLVEDGQVDQDVDDFEYSDSHFNMEWINLGAQTSRVEIFNDPETGSRALRVLPYNLISISAGQHCADRDFSLTSAACLCGKVMDEANSPLAGIEVTALSEGRNLAYYAAAPSSPGGGLNYSGRTDNMGEYCLKGLYPGEYRVLARDTQNFYNWCFYKDVPAEPSYRYYWQSYFTSLTPDSRAEFALPNQFYTRLYQDLYDRQFDNATCSFQAIHRGRMELSLEVETVNGREMTIILRSGTDEDTGYLDSNTHIVVSVDPEGFYSQSEPGWFKETKDLNTELLKHPQSIGTLQRINGVGISGNDYRIDFIKFFGDGNQPVQVVDEFNYAEANDLPTDHGWVNDYPDTTYLVMVEDKDLDRRVLAVSAIAPVGLSQGEKKESVDFHLKPGARIEGTVTAADSNAPLAGISVVAQEANSTAASGYTGYPYGGYYGNYGGYNDFSTYTDNIGHYTLFIPCYEGQSKEYSLAATDYQNIYAYTAYDQKISVTSGTMITGVNLSMSRAASISGQVTAASDGQPMANIRVEARVANECYPSCLDCGDDDNECCPPPGGCSRYMVIQSTYTDTEGRYTLQNLSPDGYIICAQSKWYWGYIIWWNRYGYNQGFYDDNSDYLDPSIILTSGRELTSIDIQLTTFYTYYYYYPYFSPSIGGDSSGYYGGYYGSSFGGSYGGGLSTPSASPTVYSYGTQSASQGYYSYGPSTSNPLDITSNPEPTAIVDEEYTYLITIRDPNSFHDDLTFQLTQAPEGMQLDDPNGRITWTPNSDQIDSHQVNLGINSNVSGITRQEFTIKVLDYKDLGPCGGDYDASDWVIESGNGSLNCVYDQALKTYVLETLTSETNSLDFAVKFAAADLPSQSTTPKEYLSLAISDTDVFCLRVHVRANSNDYTLIYNPTEGETTISGNTIHHHLGSLHQDGDWHMINRDLQADLPVGINFEYVKYFQLQGDYRLYGLKIGINPFDDEIICLNLLPGLNLIGLSKDIVEEYNDSARLFAYLDGNTYVSRLKKYNTYQKSWQAHYPSPGYEFEIKDYHGYCLYAKEHFKVVFRKGKSVFNIQELAGRLRPGMNLIHISRIPRQSYLASELVKELKTITNTKVINIQKYQPPAGRWLGVYGFFDMPIEDDFELKIGEGYIINVM